MKERKPRGALQTKNFWLLLFAFCAPASPAFAASPFDGSWNLLFVTQYGACDPTYNFTVGIRDGILFHPNLRRLTGRVAPSGAVHASVAVEQKFHRAGVAVAGRAGNRQRQLLEPCT